MFFDQGGGQSTVSHTGQPEVDRLASFPSLHCIDLSLTSTESAISSYPACQAEHLINCLDTFSGPQDLRARQSLHSLGAHLLI